MGRLGVRGRVLVAVAVVAVLAGAVVAVLLTGGLINKSADVVGKTLHAPSAAATTPAAVTPPAPSPVSTAANVTSRCVMGSETSTASGPWGNFTAGPVTGSAGDPALAYQLTLTDNSANTAEVTGFAVVFYDAAGQEAGSDQEGVTPEFIVGEQSLTWTELASATLQGDGDGGQDSSIPASAATCSLVQWYAPPPGG